MSERGYSELTLAVTKQLSKIEKKAYGFFVTPPSIIDPLISRVIHHQIQEKIVIEHILEPSCGTCEIVTAVSSKYPSASIVGIEWNPTVFESIQKNMTSVLDRIQLYHADFLTHNKPETYDLVIGNPPYFVCSKETVPEKYREWMVGRPNMFGVFIIHALAQLKPGSILAFVIPKSFMNAAFYAEIRKHIKETCRILEIIDFESCNDFLDTQQKTFGLLLRKVAVAQDGHLEECAFSMKIGEQWVFTENAEGLRELLRNSTTLKALGYSVKTGTIVWNQHKDKVTHDASKTLLIYNSNIENNQIVAKTFSNEEKKQFIDLPGLTEPCLVVNRGNGNSTYNLTYALVEGRRPYLIENHLNRIVYTGKTETSPNYTRILQSFQDPRTKRFLESFIGNGGLSKTELETIFPIYL
jgi:adenine-specific DNA-methyltransferase